MIVIGEWGLLKKRSLRSVSDFGLFNTLFLTQASLVTTAYKKSPIHFVYQASFFCDPVGIRTPNLRIRNAMLYPVELQGHFLLKASSKRTAKILTFLSNATILEVFHKKVGIKKSAAVARVDRLDKSRQTSFAITDADPPVFIPEPG